MVVPADLPETVTKLEGETGGVVYLVGTAHFSEESQRDVAKTIQLVRPNIVMLELCDSRVSILQFDEQALLNETKNISMTKVRAAINQLGVLQGVLHILLLSMSAHITRQLGMAPGGEFRRAWREACTIPNCRVELGDRPIQITMKRAILALSMVQKVRLVWYILTCQEPISKEDIEKYKKKDILEEVIEEMTGEFPALSQVFLDERDQYLAYSLREMCRGANEACGASTGGCGGGYDDGGDVDGSCDADGGCEGDGGDLCGTHGHVSKGGVSGGEGHGKGSEETIVVGVVGIGHVPGIVKYWGKDIDVMALLSTTPPTSYVRSTLKWSIRLAFGLITCWSGYRLARVTPFIKRLVT